MFIKKSIANRLNNLDFDIIKLGVGGNFGNKGGVLVRLNIDNSSLCFINCHLESGQKLNKARINNINDIHNLAF